MIGVVILFVVGLLLGIWIVWDRDKTEKEYSEYEEAVNKAWEGFKGRKGA